MIKIDALIEEIEYLESFLIPTLKKQSNYKNLNNEEKDDRLEDIKDSEKRLILLKFELSNQLDNIKKEILKEK